MIERLVERIAFWSSEDGYACFGEGFTVGLAIALLLALVLLLIASLLHGRRRCRGVTIPGENGTLFVTVNAVREFVSGVLAEFREAALRGVELRKKRGGLLLTVELAVLPDTAILPLSEKVRARLLEEAGQKIGLDRDLQVNITVRSLSAREEKIARQARKARPPASSAVPSGAADTAEQA